MPGGGPVGFLLADQEELLTSVIRTALTARLRRGGER